MTCKNINLIVFSTTKAPAIGKIMLEIITHFLANKNG